MVKAAIAFAANLLKSANEGSEAKIKRAFELAVSRQPDAFELAALKKLLESETQHYRVKPEDAEKLLDAVDKSIDAQPLNQQELAAWTTVTRALLNLQETVTRY